ncbi:phosphoglycerate mutase-like protein [Heliocybe sulcata]|uniref:Phosphoglycerate mutase-like protein n=1 Tax=Heliocybe sulcata TaxID=5364 RepID=A0A5C3N0U6_9AGAM|nr:phosphoglycerate mutase-like protein [Heliocybe sulcata]
MSHVNVKGAVILARNGDRSFYYQNPETYAPGLTESTPLGEAQAHELGKFLRATYLSSNSPSRIQGMRYDLADTKEIHIKAKNGGEGKPVFDSCIALLQGLFPPNPNNRMTLANGQTVMAPLNGYQYIPVETVEPSNDRSLESWTNCPAFEKHVQNYYGSDEFKKEAKNAEPFFNAVKGFVYGPEVSFQNAYNVYDYIGTELTYNQSYAYRLPPTYIEQAQHWANIHENGVFSSKDINGIGNIAGRTILSTILDALERVVFDDDPLQLMVQQISYQPIISLFHMTGIAEKYPELQGLPNFASALSIELRGGDEGDPRDFLRFKFKNGTDDEAFRVLNVFGHNGDIPLTEFIYRTENYVIDSNRQWDRVCSGSPNEVASTSGWVPDITKTNSATLNVLTAAMIAVLMVFGMFSFGKFVARKSKRRSYVRLEESEVSYDPFWGERRALLLGAEEA